ncbi:MAG TPA: hypothetical protein ACYCDB_00240 [Candidatus Azoamicus sp.]
MFDVSKVDNPFDDKIFRLILDNFKTKEILIIYNKIDLLEDKYNFIKHDAFSEFYISIKKEIGLDDFIKHINLSFSSINNEIYLIDKKFIGLFVKLKDNFLKSEAFLNTSYNLDFLSDNLRLIYNDLSIILGKNIEVDIIKKIFSNFCLGK